MDLKLYFLKNDIVEVIPSHKGHYITAYNIYKDNKLFGAGIKSFRYSVTIKNINTTIVLVLLTSQHCIIVYQ